MRTFSLLAIFATALAGTIVTSAVFTSPGQAAGAAPDADAVPALPAPTTGDDVAAGTEVLTRGPVHEAYATPLELNPQTGPIVKKEPPPAIEEIPPDQKPEGDNVIWIPGYFAWDEDRQDFLWVSGVWRNIPPGQTWVAGYWSKVADGYQWTPGFWTGAKKAEVTYVTEALPASLETGPTSPQPAENQFWIPGTWVYQDRYVWQAGYWGVVQPNWVWIPAHWMWTPGGFVFIPGFWDYEPAYRGCLFAPVYFSPVIYSQPNFVYCPGVVINVGFFSTNLFYGPARCHYYFGDYYAARYAGIGYRPWFEVSVGRRVGYDPLFTYYRWKHTRSDPNWVAQQKQHFEKLQNNADDRPPHTFAAQKDWMQKHGGAGKKANLLAASTLQQAAKDPTVSGVQLQAVSQKNREAFLSQAQTLNKVSKERLEIEKQEKLSGTAGGAGGPKMSPHKLKLPTITTAENKGAGSTAGQTLSQQSGQAGDAKSGAYGGKFNRPLPGATGLGQDSSSGTANLGDKNAQSLDQNKTADQGKPFGPNKFSKPDKTADQSQSSDAGGSGKPGMTFVPQGQGSGKPGASGGSGKPNVMVAPQDSDSGAAGVRGGTGSGKPNMTFVPQGQGSGKPGAAGGSGKPNMTVAPQDSDSGTAGGRGGSGTGKPNMTFVPQGQGSGKTGAPGGSGKPNMFVAPQGSGSGNAGAQSGSGKPSVFGQQGSGGQQRMFPGGPPANKDKDDDQPSKKGNRSDTTSPRTNFSLQRSTNPTIDVSDVVEKAKDSMQGDMTRRSDNLAKDALNDKLINNKNTSPSSSGTTATKPQQLLSDGLTLPGFDKGGKSALGSADKVTPQGFSSPTSGNLSGVRQGPEVRPDAGSDTSAPASMSIYRNLVGRGRSLSQPGGGDKPDADPRLNKDPIGSYGYGTSPSRFPQGGAAKYSAGGQGQAVQSGAAGSGPGLGSFQKYTPGQLPRFQRGFGNSSNAAPPNTDPAARTYDPSRESTNTYGR